MDTTQHHQLISYLQSLGLSAKEASVFLIVYRFGPKNASTIASLAKQERVWTYKTLVKFTQMGLVAETIKQGVKQFWIPSLDLIKSYISSHQQSRQRVEEDFEVFKTQIVELEPIGSRHAPPKIQLYEKNAGIKTLCQDMILSIQHQQIITIKLFATNTFETHMQSVGTIEPLLGGLLDNLNKQHIQIQSYIAQGSLIMEHLEHFDKLDILQSLPAGGRAINMFVVGQEVFLIIYKDEPVGVRFVSPEFARAMHFLLEAKG